MIGSLRIRMNEQVFVSNESSLNDFYENSAIHSAYKKTVQLSVIIYIVKLVDEVSSSFFIITYKL